VALVGAGFIADFHLEILAPLEEVEVVAVVDPAVGRARALADRWGVPEARASIEELPALEVDVAHVLVPPDLHAAVVRRLLELGVGVHAEKPFVLSGDEARALGALAAERGLALGINHNHVFQPAFTRLVERVAAGEIGTVEHVQVTWSVPLMQLDAEQYSHWMFRSPRNIVYEQGPHPLSQVHRLVGPLVEAEARVLGERELLPGQRFVDRWLVAGRGERATCEVYLAFGQGLTRNTLTVLGSDGYLEADYTHDTLSGERKSPWLEFWNSFLAAWRRGTALRAEGLRVLRGYLAATLGLAPRRDAYFVGMRESITSFHRALRAGEPLPVDACEAAEVLDWCDAVAGAVPDERAEPLELSDAPARPGEVVVLGGTGFIGKRVVARLLELGRPVTCVVRRTHSLPAGLVQAARDGRVRLVRGSLEDTAALAGILRGADSVVHLATGGGDTWEDVRRSMVEGSVRVAEACLAAGGPRLVYVSSIAAVDTAFPGTLKDSPTTDPRATERAAYARGKAATEDALQALRRERGLRLVVMRPGVVVGEGTPMQHSGYGLWVRDNHCVGWGEGGHPLPLVLVDDVAWAVAAAAVHEGEDLDGEALNLCARPPIDARTAVAELRAATGRDLHFHPRPLERSQGMEVGKWLVKRLGGRRVEYPSYHDLRTRALFPDFASNLAREVLGWRPCEEREAFLDRAVRIYGRRTRTR
jgi:predicted dehydrogenase/nucleoside-diphosphate-sugar epimerase